MRLSRFSSAVCLAAMFVHSMVSAEEGGSTLDQCVDLLIEEKLAQARPFCVEAAGQSREGVLRYGDLLDAEGDIKGAIEQYTKVLEGIEPANYTDTQITALR